MIGYVEAEGALLGALLTMQTPMVQRGLLDQLEVDDFSDPRHRVVFQAMRNLACMSTLADPITTLGQLRRSGGERAMTSDRNAGVFLADLYGAAPTVGSATHLLRILLEHRVRREADELGIRLQQIAAQASQHEVVALLREACDVVGAQVDRLEHRVRSELAEASG